MQVASGKQFGLGDSLGTQEAILSSQGIWSDDFRTLGGFRGKEQ